MADDRIDVKFGATTDELKAGADRAVGIAGTGASQIRDKFQQMSQATTQSMGQTQAAMQSGVANLTSMFGGLGKVAALAMSLLGGGALLKGAVDKFVEMNQEARKLSGIMGTNIQDAAAFIQAYNRIGVSADTVSQAMRLLERNIKSNGDSIKDMGKQVGVEIDLQADLKTIYFSVTEALGKYKEGHDRNQAAMAGFGSRVQNVNTLLRVNAEDVAKSAMHLKSLGLNFDDVSLDKARKFKAGMHDAGLQLDAVKYRIGEVAVPALTSLGRAFIWVTDRIKDMVTAESSAEGAIASLGDRAAAASRRLTYPPAKPDGKGGSSYKDPKGGGGGGGGGESIVQKWAQELEEMKMASGKFLESSLEADAAFWREKLALCERGSKEYKAVEHKLYQATKALAKENLAEKIADLKLEQAAEKLNGKERLRLEAEIVTAIEREHGKGSREAKKARRDEILVIEQEAKKRIAIETDILHHKQTLREMDLAGEREEARFKREMGIISATQEIALERDIERKRHEARRRELLDERALNAGRLEMQRKVDQEIEKEDKQHYLKMRQLDRQYIQQFRALMQSITSSFSSGIMGMIKGTMTFKEAFASMCEALGQVFFNMVLGQMAAWLMGLAFGEGVASKQIGQRAGPVYMENLLALIPTLGPFAAPGAAGALTAAEVAVARTLSLASAAQGWDVDRDALAYVHKKEMVLPPHLAEGIRGLIAQPAAPAPPGRMAQTINLHLDLGPHLKKVVTYKQVVPLVNKGIQTREIKLPAPRRR